MADSIKDENNSEESARNEDEDNPSGEVIKIFVVF